MQFRKPARLQRRLDSEVVCLALASSLACLTIERDAAGQLARRGQAGLQQLTPAAGAVALREGPGPRCGHASGH